MNSKDIRRIAKVALLATVLLFTGLFARPADAQAWIEGKFMLPYEACWDHAVLQPGEYQLMFVDNKEDTLLVIRDAKSLRTVALEPVNIREDSRGRPSTLLIGTHGKQHIVYSLTIAELGESFVYQRPPVHNSEFREARETQAVPVVVAKK